MRRLLWVVAAGAGLSGCGLLIDASPPDQRFDAAPRADGGGGMDAGVDAGGAACTESGDCAASACAVVECVAGRCVESAAPIDCDDGIDCTEDTCDPRVGCVSTANDALCPSASDDGCRVARCVPEEGGCQRRADHASCEDDHACTLDHCELRTGDCTHPPSDAYCAAALGRGSVCDPENVAPGDDLGCVPPSCGEDSDCITDCRPNATCVSGSCVPGAEATNGTACDVDLPCRAPVGACLGGVCQPSPLDCDDDNPCTDDSCAPDRGECVHDPVAAGDTRVCRIDGVCAPAACVGASCTVSGPAYDCAALNRRCRPDGNGCGLCLPGYNAIDGSATNTPCTLAVDAGVAVDAGRVDPGDGGIGCAVGFSSCGGALCNCYGRCDAGSCQPWCGSIGTLCAMGQCCCDDGVCRVEGTCSCVS